MRYVLIDGKRKPVFILRENEDRLVYIPFASLDRTEIRRLKDFNDNLPKGVDLLENLKSQRLSNGLNALIHYDRLICVGDVVNENSVEWVPKPGEAKKIDAAVTSPSHQPNLDELLKMSKTIEDLSQKVERMEKENAKPPRKKPGPKPKSEKENEG